MIQWCNSMYGRTKQMPIVQYGLVSMMLLLLLAACQEPSGGIRITPTVVSEPSDDVLSMLIQLEDMGWSGGDYIVATDPINGFPDLPIENIVGISLSPIPIVRTSKGTTAPDIRRGGQGIYIFPSKEYAIQAFNSIYERQVSGSDVQICPINTPKTEHSFSWCREGFATDIGEHLGCAAWFQHGRYLVEVVIVIDGKVVTEADWNKMLNLVQDRLVAQIEQETAVSP